MSRPPSLIPTDGELEILEIVWSLGQPTTRDVFDAVSARRSIDQATISTLMTSMERKKLLQVVDQRRPRRYAAIKDQRTTYRSMLKNLANKISRGSIAALLQQTLGRQSMSASEEAEIEREFFKED